MAKASQATTIVDLALSSEGIELFHTPQQEAYVRLPVETHRECWPVRSAAFRRWLARLYFTHATAAPGGQALTDALGVIEGIALFEGREHDVHLRLTEHDGAVYLDLADALWRAVRISATGWEIVHVHDETDLPNTVPGPSSSQVMNVRAAMLRG